MTPQDTDILEKMYQAFKECPRPSHFTNHAHCEECADHDRVLSSRTPHTLQMHDVANPAWDPICFTLPEGFAYYLPGLARLVVDEPPVGYGWYGVQFFSHLVSNGPGNDRVEHCSPEQRRTVAAFIAHLIQTRTEQIEAEDAAEDALRAFEIWNATSTDQCGS